MALSIADDTDWSVVLARVGEAIDVDASALASGALVRRRQVRSGSELLRLAMAYGPAGQSLRATAAWAELQGVAKLSDVGLMYRLQEAGDWLGEVAAALLARRPRGGAAQPGSPLAGLRIRVVDGSVISAPGKGGRWRLHATWDLAQERFSALELTKAKTAEALERVTAGSGDLMMADRVYARPDGLHAMAEGGADFLIRIGCRSLKLQNADGSDFGLAAALDRSDEAGTYDMPVRVLDGRDPDRAALTARLVVLKKPAEAIEASRKRALRESQRGGHENHPLSLRAAEHLMLITSLAPERASAERLGQVYRLRWQIELAFKRLKSLLRMDRLPAKNEKLAKAWISTHMIAALLIEDLTPEFRDTPP